MHEINAKNQSFSKGPSLKSERRDGQKLERKSERSFSLLFPLCVKPAKVKDHLSTFGILSSKNILYRTGDWI